MPALLSMKSGVGGNLDLVSNRNSHKFLTISSIFTPSPAATYSASVDDNAIHFCQQKQSTLTYLYGGL